MKQKKKIKAMESSGSWATFFGTRQAKLLELRPLTVFEEYRIRWRRAKTDLSKLARLRWIQKHSVAHIAEKLNRSPETIHNYIRRMRKPGGLKMTDLSLFELEMVNESINKIFQGK